MMDEFAIIKHFFTRPVSDKHIVVGIGDDAALLTAPANEALCVTVDALVEGTHFFSGDAAFDLGYKALAVSLSDVAAMGALPKTALLSLILPHADEAWLSDFSKGFFELAAAHHVHLIGGNIAKGPLAITTVVEGLVPTGAALLRSGACVGDRIYVTGTVGDAGFALALLTQAKMAQLPKADAAFLYHRFYRPTPRVNAGLALRGLAHAAIDISDGLAADLEKLLTVSGVGAVIETTRLPLSAVLRAQCLVAESMQYALAGGEDYELCFTAPAEKQQMLEKSFQALDVELHYIGDIVAKQGLVILDENKQLFAIKKTGYAHFTD